MGIVKSIYLKSESDWELMKSGAAKAERSVSDYLIRLVRASTAEKGSAAEKLAKIRFEGPFEGPTVSPDDVQGMDAIFNAGARPFNPQPKSDKKEGK